MKKIDTSMSDPIEQEVKNSYDKKVVKKRRIKGGKFTQKLPVDLEIKKVSEEKMDNVFCVILSKYRVYQGMVLYKSLIFNTKQFKIYMLCVDEESYEICSKLKLPSAVLVKSEEIEDEALLACKGERELNEYCWTLKPFFIDYVLQQNPNANYVTYMDADICFFNDPAPIYARNMYCDVLLSEHDYAPEYEGVESACGKYNSGFIVFRNVKNARKALEWWQNLCLEWCFDKAVDGKFGDQKYLDRMPKKFNKVCSITIPGVNIAPWNQSKHVFVRKGPRVYVDHSKLICYHFSGFRVVAENKVALVSGDRKIYEMLHFSYIHVLKMVMDDIKKVDPDFKGFVIEHKFSEYANYYDI